MKLFGRAKRCGPTALLTTGPDNIQTKFIKLVSDHLTSPLTHILNTCISKLDFPTLWKVALISPIPKVGEPQANDDFRPVFILPVLSKVYERLSWRQMVDFLTETAALQPNVSAYRKATQLQLLCLQYEMIS